jgi:positive regulator of sigma E activity
MFEKWIKSQKDPGEQMKGRVIDKKANGTIVIALMAEADEGCKGCSMGDSCNLPKMEQIEVRQDKSTMNCLKNDLVDVEVSSNKLIWLSASVYIMPLLTMIAGAFWGLPYGEPSSIAGGIIGLAVGVVLNMILNRFLSLEKIVTVRRIG